MGSNVGRARLPPSRRRVNNGVKIRFAAIRVANHYVNTLCNQFLAPAVMHFMHSVHKTTRAGDQPIPNPKQPTCQ